jgi:hypothetical protein
MEDLVRLLENYAFDDSIYWRLETFDGKFVEIHWNRQHKSTPWSINLLDDPEKIFFSSSEMPATLVKFKVEASTMSSGIKRKLLSQIVYADMFIEKASELMGKEIVDDAINEHREFSNKLLSAIQSALSSEPPETPKPTTKLRLV